MKQNPAQQKRKTTKSKKKDLKTISTKSKTLQLTKFSRNTTKKSCISKRNITKSSTKTKRKKSTKENSFQFVDTNNTNVDDCSTENQLKLIEKIDETKSNGTVIEQETTKLIIPPTDDSEFDVFADFKDSDDCDNDEDDDYMISDSYLYLKKPKFMCEICNKIFKYKSEYNRHINWIHKNRENVFLCTRCPKTFNILSEFVKHNKEHKAQYVRTIMCYICGIEKNKKVYMDDHIRMHFDERAFICHICTASFKTQKTLRDHLKRHTGIKKYKCDQCGAAFFDCSDYKRHLTKHGVVEKEFHCSICGSSFYERKLLKYHIINVHNICNGEELKFLPEPRNKNSTRFKYLHKTDKKPTETSTPQTIEKQSKSSRLSKTTKRKIDAEVNSKNVNLDQESMEDLIKVSDTRKIKEEMHVGDEPFHLDDDATNEFINGNFENSYAISDNKVTSCGDEASLNEFKNIAELNAHSTLHKYNMNQDETDSNKPEDIKFIDIISKLNETEDAVCSSLNTVQESLKLINSSAESFEDFNEEKLQFIHLRIGVIASEFHKLIQNIPKQKKNGVIRFLPLNDIDTLDEKLNDKSFNEEFTKYFETCYPLASPHNLEDIEQILSDSFLEQYSVRRTVNRKFIDHKCLMKTLHKIWTQECKTYKEFEKLMRSQVWKVMQSYKKKHKAEQQ